MMDYRWQPTGISGGGGMETPSISPHDPNLMLLNCDMSGAYRSTEGGARWEMIHWAQLTGCPFCAAVFHPVDADVIFAAHSYAATLRVSRDRGVTWQPIGEGLPGNLRRLAINPVEPAVMLAATREAVYRSADGGARWERCAGFAGEALGIVFDHHSGCWIAATATGVFRSMDGGASWQPHGTGLAECRLAAFAGGSHQESGICRLYCWTVEGAVFRSLDGGATWAHCANLPVRQGYEGYARWLLVSEANPEIVYAVRPDFSAEDTVRRSADSGSSWQQVAFCDKTDPRFNLPANYITDYFLPRSLWGWSTCGAAIDPSNPDHLMFDHYCSLFITKDGGQSWQAGDVHAAPDSRWVNNGLVITTTWHYYFDPFQHDRRYICYTDLGLFRSEDAGKTWGWHRDIGANVYEIAFDPEVPGRMWAALSQVHDIPNNNIVVGSHTADGYGCVGYSEDSGDSWSERNLGQTVSDSSWPEWATGEDYSARRGLPVAPVTSVILDSRSPADSRTLYASVWQHGVFRSTDGGLTWSPRAQGLGAPGVNMRVCRLRVHADGTLFCVVTGRQVDGRLIREGVGLYRSADGGGSWQEITTGLDIRWTTDFDVDPRDSRVIYLGVCDDPGRDAKEGGLYKTIDGGQAWTRIARKSSLHFGATVRPDKPDWVYLTLTYNDAASPPLWLSKDAGTNWEPFENYPFCSAHRVHVDPEDDGTIYVTSYGGSVWKGPAEPEQNTAQDMP